MKHHVIKDDEEYELFMAVKTKELEKALQTQWGGGRIAEVKEMPTHSGGMMRITERWGPTARLLLVDNLRGLQERYLVWQMPLGKQMIVNWCWLGWFSSHEN